MMIKIFKIIEKIVYCIAALAIVAVIAMIVIGALGSVDKISFDLHSCMLFFYGAAIVVVIYKTIVLCFTSSFQKEIDVKTGILGSMIDAQKKEGDLSPNENPLNKKLDAITEAVK